MSGIDDSLLCASAWWSNVGREDRPYSKEPAAGYQANVGAAVQTVSAAHQGKLIDPK